MQIADMIQTKLLYWQVFTRHPIVYTCHASQSCYKTPPVRPCWVTEGRGYSRYSSEPACQPASLSRTQWCHPTGVLHSFFFFVWLPSRFFAASRCDARGLELGLLRLGAHDSRHALGHWQREEARPMFQRAETTASYSGVTVWSPSVSRLGCSVLGRQNARMPECQNAAQHGRVGPSGRRVTMPSSRCIRILY